VWEALDAQVLQVMLDISQVGADDRKVEIERDDGST
jgi:hypothetical protein